MRFFNRELEASKAYVEGTHRTRSPQDTLAAWMPLMPALGITRLANVTGLDCVGIPVYMAVRPNSRSISISQGKGLDAAAAKASALLESIEGWHGEHVGHGLRFERASALAREAATVDVELLPLNVADPDFDRPLLWMQGWDLVQGEPCWVPYETVTTNFVLSRQSTATFLMSSNGLASGNHLLEAMSHGICEVIERDSMAKWRRFSEARQEARRLDLATVDDPHCRELLRRLAAAGVRVHAWCIPNTYAVPVYTCIIEDARPEGRELGPSPGFGCHPTAGVALSRALTEAAQVRLTAIAGSRDDVLPDQLEKLRAQYQRRRPAGADGGDLPAGPFRFTRAADIQSRSLGEDVEALTGVLRRGGVRRVVAVDLTHERVGVPVVKVVIPGLEVEAGRTARGALNVQ
jgi:YcaO-like protein with predicted kinase domain